MTELRVVETRGVSWRVDVTGEGRTVLCLHGAGGAGASWRGVAAAEASALQWVAPDLPGQGGSRSKAPGRGGLEAVASDLRDLLATLSLSPDLVVGHSAGAAIALQLALDGLRAPVLGFAPAILPFDGPAALMMPALARLTALNPFAPYAIASGMSRAGVRAMISGLGSRATEDSVALYTRLLGDPAHVGGTIALMARWDVGRLATRLKHLDVPVALVLGGRDPAVPAAALQRLAAAHARIDLQILPEFGHLLHEEAPRIAGDLITAFLDRQND
ncbi:MAG: alpha/beta fold hydrolase BchO [Pseudomonadota bacterium]